MIEARRPSLGALTPGSAQQLAHRAPTTGAKKPRLSSSSEDAGRHNHALAATPSEPRRRESGIELHVLPSQDLRNMSARGKRFGFTREQWSAWRGGDQFSDDENVAPSKFCGAVSPPGYKIIHSSGVTGTG